MDTFVDPQVPMDGGSKPPPPGVVSFGAADYSEASDGYLGATDPTFAGLSLQASSPFECNTKASEIATGYNQFARDKTAFENYEAADEDYKRRCKTECYCGTRAYSICNEDMKNGLFVDNPDLCGPGKHIAAFWKNGKPVAPRKGVSLDQLYVPDKIDLYNAVAQQTARCIPPKGCGLSISDGAGVPAVTDLAWTFFAKPADAPFGMQCQVHFRKSDKLVPNQNALTGTGDNDLGRRALATVPYIRSNCAPSKLGLPTTECTALATALSVENSPALAWWHSLPDDEAAQVSKTTEIKRICNTYDVPDAHRLSECACQNAELSESFKKLQSNFSTSTKFCWYSPCAVHGIDRLLTPSDEEARDNCNADLCSNIINGFDNQGLNFNDVQMSVNCSSQDIARGVAAAGGDAKGIIAGTADKIADLISDVDWGAVAGVVAAGVVVLLLLAAAAWLWSSGGPPPAATADKTVPPVVVPPAAPPGEAQAVV
jgi:hypothetical protein